MEGGRYSNDTALWKNVLWRRSAANRRVTGRSDPRDHVLGHNEDMHGRLRIDIVKSEKLVRLIHDAGGDLTGDDFFEDRHG